MWVFTVPPWVFTALLWVFIVPLWVFTALLWVFKSYCGSLQPPPNGSYCPLWVFTIPWWVFTVSLWVFTVPLWVFTPQTGHVHSGSYSLLWVFIVPSQVLKLQIPQWAFTTPWRALAAGLYNSMESPCCWPLQLHGEPLLLAFTTPWRALAAGLYNSMESPCCWPLQLHGEPLLLAFTAPWRALAAGLYNSMEPLLLAFTTPWRALAAGLYSSMESPCCWPLQLHGEPLQQAFTADTAKISSSQKTKPFSDPPNCCPQLTSSDGAPHSWVVECLIQLFPEQIGLGLVLLSQLLVLLQRLQVLRHVLAVLLLTNNRHTIISWTPAESAVAGTVVYRTLHGKFSFGRFAWDIKHLKKVVRLCSVEVYRTLHGNSLLWAFHLGHKAPEEIQNITWKHSPLGVSLWT